MVPLRDRLRARRRGPPLSGPGAALAAACAAGGLRLPAGLLAAIAAAGGDGIDPALPGAIYQARAARPGRRAAGMFYSPPHLVDLVLDRALAPALGATAPRVLDPACGAGAFLIAALARLEADAIRRGARPGPALRTRLAGALVGIDRDPVAVDLARLSLALAIAGDGRPPSVAGLAAAARAVRVGDALAAPPPTVEVVVGNPPWGQKGFALAPAERARLRAHYRSCARGPIDPFAPFVELGLRALGPGGRFGWILPDVILLKAQAAVRELVLGEAALDLVAHAGRAFPGVNLDVVVVVGTLGRPRPRHRVTVWPTVPASPGAAPPPARRIPQRAWAELPGRVWNLELDEPLRAVLAALDRLPRLGQRFEIHEGVHSGNARRKLFVAARPAGGARLVVGGRELERYRLRWAGRWLDRSPAALDRAAGDYASLGRAAWFAADKLVVRRTGDRVVAAFDGDGLHVSNNLFVLVPRGAPSRAELHALTALLNSRFMTGYFRAVVPRRGRLFAELKIHHLAAFPLPPSAALTAALPELATLARARAAGDDRAATDARIDAIVESLYPISRQAARSITMRA